MHGTVFQTLLSQLLICYLFVISWLSSIWVAFVLIFNFFIYTFCVITIVTVLSMYFIGVSRSRVLPLSLHAFWGTDGQRDRPTDRRKHRHLWCPKQCPSTGSNRKRITMKFTRRYMSNTAVVAEIDRCLMYIPGGSKSKLLCLIAHVYTWGSFGPLFLSFFLIWGDTRSLRMPALRSASQAGPMRNPREGTSVVLRDTTRLTWWCV